MDEMALNIASVTQRLISEMQKTRRRTIYNRFKNYGRTTD
jgi:hypothetical protein